MSARKLPTPLRIAIAASGLTQREIAERAGVSEVHLSRIVNRHRHADDVTQRRIACAVGRRVEELFPADAEGSKAA